ncbi:uncharacterized protein LOC129290760 [Prosopis cineraria]|uniref:uncharacterized protein LOC129290760 n=1 Tax=Prosopis cineraria TaxID=364024 RepID=UPI00240FB829|nr:uncharacterized protein LOC129290760 [Prosopis cineraria]
MPLLEITNAQRYFHCSSYSLGAQKPFYGKITSISFTFGNELRLPCAWKSLEKLKKVSFNEGRVKLPRGRLLIKSVATLEPKRLAADEDKCLSFKDSETGANYSRPIVRRDSFNDEPEELDEREKMRRMRISKANSGNTPWNKGRKHSPETLQKIRERTRLAMQNPKVRMKLVDLGHAQTMETRQKIGIGVRKGWERRIAKRMVQEACIFEWQNLIAEASRQGFVGEEEMQWDSYGTLNEQLQQEWLESVEQRKKMQRAPHSKRAPKSPEQRRKIAEAISAKWADPEYRQRVCSALAKYHGTADKTERKPRRKPSDGTESTRRNPLRKKSTETRSFANSNGRITQKQLRRRSSPVYKDPLASFKFDMIMNIRAQRADAETKQTEAIERARLLIAEAEKAANALEAAATKSPIAQASLMETRKLINEAIQSLESIETQHITESAVSSSVSLSETDQEKGATLEVLNQSDIVPVNGHRAFPSSDYKLADGKFSLHELLNGDLKLHLSATNGIASSPLGFESESDSTSEPKENLQDQGKEHKADSSPKVMGIQSVKDETPSKSLAVTKKWVRGRLVEVIEETH